MKNLLIALVLALASGSFALADGVRATDDPAMVSAATEAAQNFAAKLTVGDAYRLGLSSTISATCKETLTLDFKEEAGNGTPVGNAVYDEAYEKAFELALNNNTAAREARRSGATDGDVANKICFDLSDIQIPGSNIKLASYSDGMARGQRRVVKNSCQELLGPELQSSLDADATNFRKPVKMYALNYQEGFRNGLEAGLENCKFLRTLHLSLATPVTLEKSE